ncbi:sporulation protein YjcZ [Bacillus sp. M6-12]|nr:YjcZ family sporulation protein [Bacillus sp. M6-12]PLS18717.1 sporulation protein YjcZ [Bacillus sp. M6-12]
MGCFGFGRCGGYTAPVYEEPRRCGGGFALIVVLFILLIILGCVCFGEY